MAKTKQITPNSTPKSRPAMTPEARQNQLIAMATNLAEQQLRDGTASSQVITHFLKLGTKQAELELEKMRRENELLKVKTESIKSAEHMEELYKNAIEAMQIYSGRGRSNDH